MGTTRTTFPFLLKLVFPLLSLALLACEQAKQRKYPRDFALLKMIEADSHAWIVLEGNSTPRGQASLDTLLRLWRNHPEFRFYLVDKERFPLAWERLGGQDSAFPLRLLKNGKTVIQVQQAKHLRILSLSENLILQPNSPLYDEGTSIKIKEQ